MKLMLVLNTRYLKPLHVNNAGYRVIEIENAHNHSNNKLADGFYVGAGLSF